MSAIVPVVVSNQNATAQTSSLTLSFTPSASGLYRLNAYFVISSVTGDAYNMQFGWTDDHQTWLWGPNSGPGKTVSGTHWFAQPMSALVRAVSGQPISLVYTVTGGTPSADMYLIVEDCN